MFSTAGTITTRLIGSCMPTAATKVPITRGGAAHVVLHLLDAALRLQVDAAGIEGDALADQHVGLGVAAVVPLQHDQLGRIGRAARDREQRAHAQFLHLRRGRALRTRPCRSARRIPAPAGPGRPGCRCSAAGCRVRGRTATPAAMALPWASAALSSPRMASVLQAGLVALLVLGAERGGVAVAGVVGGDRGLADVPGGVAALDRRFRSA